MKRLLFGFVFLVSIQVNAWEGTDLTIKHIDVKGNGSASVYYEVDTEVASTSDSLNPKGCSQAGTISWDGANVSSQNYLSTFLAAKMSESKVQILVDSSLCLWGGWPSLLTVRIK